MQGAWSSMRQVMVWRKDLAFNQCNGIYLIVGWGSGAIFLEGLLTPPTIHKTKKAVNMEMVNILGTEYSIEWLSENNDEKLKECYGYCDQYTKRIVISDGECLKNDVMSVGDIDKFLNKTLRHEIIHAFLGESGLRSCSEWAENEEMVDWLAIQIPKIVKAFEDVGIV